MDSNIKVGVGAVIIEDGKILLAQRTGAHAAGTYGSVGGHLEFEETPIEAIKREVMEELGIDICDIEFLCCSNILKYQRHVINITFTAKIKAGTPTIQEPDRITALKWFNIDNLPDNLFEPLKLALEALQTNKKYFEYTEDSD